MPDAESNAQKNVELLKLQGATSIKVHKGEFMTNINYAAHHTVQRNLFCPLCGHKIDRIKAGKATKIAEHIDNYVTCAGCGIPIAVVERPMTEQQAFVEIRFHYSR